MLAECTTYNDFMFCLHISEHCELKGSGFHGQLGQNDVTVSDSVMVSYK